MDTDQKRINEIEIRIAELKQVMPESYQSEAAFHADSSSVIIRKELAELRNELWRLKWSLKTHEEKQQYRSKEIAGMLKYTEENDTVRTEAIETLKSYIQLVDLLEKLKTSSHIDSDTKTALNFAYSLFDETSFKGFTYRFSGDNLQK